MPGIISRGRAAFWPTRVCKKGGPAAGPGLVVGGSFFRPFVHMRADEIRKAGAVSLAQN